MMASRISSIPWDWVNKNVVPYSMTSWRLFYWRISNSFQKWNQTESFLFEISSIDSPVLFQSATREGDESTGNDKNEILHDLPGCKLCILRISRLSFSDLDFLLMGMLGFSEQYNSTADRLRLPWARRRRFHPRLGRNFSLPWKPTGYSMDFHYQCRSWFHHVRLHHRPTLLLEIQHIWRTKISHLLQSALHIHRT